MGQLTIPANATVYIDTAPVIYSVETNPDYWKLLQPLWAKSQAHEIDIISSDLLLLETLASPIRSNNAAIIDLYEALFEEDIQSILRSAAHLRAITSLKTPDAIHAATALSTGCTLFLTNDGGLRAVPGLSVIVLKDVLNA
jgi:predicted nucleic acid-binding protein